MGRWDKTKSSMCGNFFSKNQKKKEKKKIKKKWGFRSLNTLTILYTLAILLNNLVAQSYVWIGRVA